jgi:hypothetical protein
MEAQFWMKLQCSRLFSIWASLFQIAPTIAAIHWFFAGFIALFTAWSPIVGTVLGMVGAHYAWGGLGCRLSCSSSVH